MNKQFGYKELEMSFGILPIKVGMYTIEGLCKDFGIGFYDLPSLMEIREIEFEVENPNTGLLERNKVNAELPKDPPKFFRLILLHSANYIPWREGKKLYTEADAFDWMEEIGFATPVAFEIIALFRQVARSGVAAPKTTNTSSKKKANQSRSKLSADRQ